MSKKVFAVSLFSFLLCLLLAMPVLADSDSPWIGGAGSSNPIESSKNKNSAQDLNELLKGFQQGCSVGSPQLDEVFNVVNTLRNAISNVRNSKDCENLNEVMLELNSSSMNARSLYPSELDKLNGDMEIAISGLERRRREVLFMLSQTSDADEIQELKVDLRNIQLDLSQYQGESASAEYNDKQIRKVRAMNILTQNTYSALNTVLNNKKCLAEHPELLEVVSGVSLGVSSSLASISPVGSAAAVVGWGAGLMSGLIQLFEEKSDQKRLMSFDVSNLPVTMTCTLEKLNNLYCASEDTLIALDKYSQYSEAVAEEKDPIWVGAQLANRSLPIAFNWLERLKNGSTPSDISDASKFNSIDEIELSLRKGLRGMEGSVAYYERNFNAGASRESQWRDLTSTVTNIAHFTCPPSSNSSTSFSNTICEFKDHDTIRFYLIGITSEITYTKLKKDYPNSSYIFDQYKSIDLLEKSINNCSECPQESISFSSQSIRNRYLELYARGMERFNIIKQREGAGDLAIVFTSAVGMSAKQAEYNQKPLRSFQNIHKFLSNSPIPDERTPQASDRLVNETLNTVQIIIDNIQCASNNTCDLFEARRKVLDATEITRDSSKLSNRIRYLVKSYVDYQVFETTSQKDNWKLQYMASRDYLSELQNFYTVGDSKIKVENQALTVQASVTNALKNFQKNYNQILKNTFDTIQKNYSQDPRSMERAKLVLCYQTLGLKWDEMFKPCLGLEAKKLHARGKNAPKITRDLYNQERRIKSCTYRNFLRLNNLEERRYSRSEML